jgi:DNA-binding response OmpR family regulator
MGKTSLLSQISAWQMGRLPETECLYLWLRLATIPRRTSVQFWEFFWQQLKSSSANFGLNWPTAQPPQESWALFGEIEEMIATLINSHGVKRLLILVDDFDFLLNVLTRRDLDWMLVLTTQFRQQLAFTITSTLPLSEMEASVVQRENPEPWQPITQFSSIFQTRWLGLLTEKEARSLCQRSAYFKELPPPSEEAVQFIIQETGAHPDLLKVGLSYLFERQEEKQGDSLFAEVRSDIRLDDHTKWLCQRMWQRRSPAEQAALAALANDDSFADTFLLQSLQKKSAIVIWQHDVHSVFSAVFAHWIRRWTAPPPAVSAPIPVPPSTATGPVVESGDVLAYEPKKRLVSRGDMQVKLTPLEGRLLGHFLQKPEQVCTTEELLDNLWGAGKSMAVVEKAVNRLRQKIEVDPKRPRFILSARGEGYILRIT